MSFAMPFMLGFLPLAPLIAWWWFRRRRAALRYADLSLVADLPHGKARRAEIFAAALRGGIVAAFIVALAGPRLPDESTRLPTEGIAIYLACDVSGSMAERDYRWQPNETITRLEAAKRAFQLFVAGGLSPDGDSFPGRPQDQIGLIAFAAWPDTECPLTLNHTVLLTILEAQKPREAGLDSGTNIGDAIAEALIRFEAAGNRKKVLILLSDGEHNATGEGPNAPLQPRQAAQLAANLGTPIYTIDCGGDPKPDAPPEQQQQRIAGRAILQSVAEMTGGTSFVANNGAELRETYRTIDRLERQPIISYRYRRYFELYPWCLASGFGLLVLLQVCEAMFWRRWP